MQRYKISENFFLDEFVGPEVHKQYASAAIWFLDRRIVIAMQYLRSESGRAIQINNWMNKGDFDERGHRMPNTKTGSFLSQHKAGRATDSNMTGFTTKQYFDFVMANEKYLIENQLITAIENIESTPTWLHCDCRYTGLNQILIVNP